MNDKYDVKDKGAVDTASDKKENTTPITETAEDEEEESLLIKFHKPYKFEGNEYTEIDLSGLDDLSAQDMIAVNKHMKRTNPGIDVMPEVSLEYALNLAAKACKQPVEFFLNLPPKEAMRVKSCVTGFLFGSE